MSVAVALARPPRKDKKREIKCPLSREMYLSLSKRADQHEMSLMGYIESLANQAIHTEPIIRALSPYFRRGYVPRYAPHTALLGRVISHDLDALLPDEKLSYKRQSVKFTQDNHLSFCELAFALCTSQSRTLAILMNECLLQGIDL